jgi:hypothetical protein
MEGHRRKQMHVPAEYSGVSCDPRMCLLSLQGLYNFTVRKIVSDARQNFVKITTLVRFVESCWTQQAFVRHFATYRQLQLHYEMFSSEWGLFNFGSKTLQRVFLLNQIPGAFKLAALLHQSSYSQYITANCPLAIVSTQTFCEVALSGQEIFIKNDLNHAGVQDRYKKKDWRYMLTAYICGIKLRTFPKHLKTLNVAIFWYIAQCSTCINRHFGGTYHLHL